MTTLARKTRYSGHEAMNSVIRADWMKAIELSPDAFEASLFRPSKPIESTDTDEHYQEETVLEIDINRDSLTYDEAELVKIIDCPDEQESFFMTEANDEGLGENADPLLLRVASSNVPIGSVLEWDEETATGIRTVWWYVHKAMGLGTANVGVIYICIPMRDFNSPPAIDELPSEPDTGDDIEPDAPETEESDNNDVVYF